MEQAKVLLPIGNVLGILWNLRKVDDNMTVSMAYSLMLIADSPNLSLKDMADRCGIAMSTASRHLKAFMDANIVKAVEDPMERRKKKIYLTPYGEKMLNDVRNGLVIKS